MCTPSAPPAPDYKLAAQQTAAGNQNASIAAQYGNMTNQVGPQQYSYDAETGKYTPTGTSTGVTYTNPAKLDSQGSMPFDMSSLTQKQKDAYNAGQGLPKNFVKTYDPQQWNQAQTLGANDQQLFNQSQATQLGLSGMALTGLDKVKQAISQGVAPELAIQGGPAATADLMTKSVNAPTFTGGNLNTTGLQGSVGDAGQIRTTIGDVNGQAQYVVNNNGERIVTSSGADERAGGLAATLNNSDKIQTSATADQQASALGAALNNSDKIQTSATADQQAGALGAGLNNSTQIQTSLGLDPTLLNQQAVDALYKANTQYLDPQFAQSQAKMESQLANQGITRGSEAYNNAMLNFNNQKQQAYTDARNQAIGQGTAAAQGLFGMGLQGAQFGNTSLGQQFGQNAAAQQLANASAQQNNQNAQVNMGLINQAYGQQFGQNVTAQQLANASAGQNNANVQTNMGLTNAALGQQFGQNLQAGQFANSAQQQAYNQAQGNAQFQNAAQAQQYGQNLSNMQAQNAAVNQRFGMDTSNQTDSNSAQQQTFNAGLANANLNNEQLSQLYNQQLQSAQLSNQASNQQLAQNQAIQQNPLNILQALRTGAQLNTANLPQVGTSQPGQLANWQGADMLGAATAQGQYDQSVYNAQAAANAQMMSAGIGAAGALGGAGIGAAVKSDRRLKKNIKRIGTHVLGIGLYTWDYLWGQPFSGVMADEVEQVMPEAIVMHPSGFKMVNYEMLGLM